MLANVGMSHVNIQNLDWNLDKSAMFCKDLLLYIKIPKEDFCQI